MKFIKKLLNFTYTREVILLIIAYTVIYAIHQTPWLLKSKFILDTIVLIISGGFAFSHLTDLSNKSNSKRRDEYNSGLLSISFATILFSIVALIALSAGYFLDVEESYTKHYMYQPIQIVKDNNEVQVIGKTQILRSSKISDYLSNDLKICKDEQYSAARIRLSDNVYICK